MVKYNTSCYQYNTFNVALFRGHKASTFIWSCGFGYRPNAGLLFTFVWLLFGPHRARGDVSGSVSCLMPSVHQLGATLFLRGDYQVCFLTESLCLIKKSSRLNKVKERAGSCCNALLQDTSLKLHIVVWVIAQSNTLTQAALIILMWSKCNVEAVKLIMYVWLEYH